MFKLITDSRIEYDMSYPVGMNMPQVSSYLEIYQEIIENNIPKSLELNFLCRGSSGAIIAGILANNIKWHKTGITHIKKYGEESHHMSIDVRPDTFNIIVDDFTSSGNTVTSIYREYINAGGPSSKVHMLLVSGNLCTRYQTLEFIDQLEIVACGTVSEEFRKKYPDV